MLFLVRRVKQAIEVLVPLSLRCLRENGLGDLVMNAKKKMKRVLKQRSREGLFLS